MIKEAKILKIYFACIIFASGLWAKTLVNGISVLVNNEPITLYEIHHMSKQLNIPIEQALGNLVEKRLQDSQIKKLGIKANSFEINEKIDEVAKKNDMSSFELLNFVRSQGINENDYREEIANAIKNEKLFKIIFKKNIPSPSETEMKAFYNANKNKFPNDSIFDVMIYTAQTYTALQEIQNSPMKVVAGVRIDAKKLNSQNLEKKTAYYLNQTAKGNFTPILKQDNGTYIMYLMGEKKDLKTMAFENAKPIILQELAKKYEKDIINNYFDKLKASADIEIIRKP